MRTASLLSLPFIPALAAALPQADVVFTSTREGNAEIYLLSARDGGITNLTRHPDGDNWPVWSPDGRKIAFQRRHEGEFDIWVMNADGSDPLRLTDEPDHEYLPVWSADGASLFYTAWRVDPQDGVRRPYLYAMRADGSNRRRLPLASIETSAGAASSPDGRFIAYSRGGENDTAVICIARTDGTGERHLTQPDGGYHGSPAWSPDSRRLVFSCDRGAAGSSIEVMDADGSGRRTVLAQGRHWYPHWSPDGEWLLLTSMNPEDAKGDVGLFAVRADGSGGLTPLAPSTHREAEGSWRPAVAGR